MKEKRLGIGIIAPSNTMKNINTILIDIGKKKLESLGFMVKIAPNVFKSNIYCSSKITDRIDDINCFLDDDSIDVIMAAYGGYNGNELLPYLNYEKIKQKNKIFIGYSDFTAIINAIYKKAGIKTYLGPSFVSFCNPNIFDQTIDTFLDVINGKEQIILNEPEFFAYDDWYLKDGFGPRDINKHLGFKVIKEGSATGIAIGGNTETLLALAGTEFFPDTKNKILFLESLPNEGAAKFMREFVQLSQIKVFDNINGLILGQVSKESKLSDDKILKELIESVVNKNKIPIIANVNISHVSPIFTIPIGGTVRITAELDKECKIEILGGK